ncbi:MAG: NAD-dependent epimerase/dehydratase family protein, partial [Gemmatimonadota bacterium]
MIVVTGGLGFIGRHLVRRFVAEGRGVRILTRGHPRTGSALVVSVGAEPDLATLRAALEGADTVVHLAARVHVMRETSGDPLEAFRRANVELTRRIVRAASDVGVRRLLFASSVKAMGESTTSPWTEQSATRPVDPY